MSGKKDKLYEEYCKKYNEIKKEMKGKEDYSYLPKKSIWIANSFLKDRGIEYSSTLQMSALYDELNQTENYKMVDAIDEMIVHIGS